MNKSLLMLRFLSINSELTILTNSLTNQTYKLYRESFFGYDKILRNNVVTLINEKKLKIAKLREEFKEIQRKIFIGKKFCEMFLYDGKYCILESSITDEPIEHLSPIDINRKFVLLTEILSYKDGKALCRDVILSLKSGNLIPIAQSNQKGYGD